MEQEVNQKKKLHCTNRNHLLAFNYAIEPDLEMIDECEYEEIPAPKLGYVNVGTDQSQPE